MTDEVFVAALEWFGRRLKISGADELGSAFLGAADAAREVLNRNTERDKERNKKMHQDVPGMMRTF